jgi:hypothetical protein
LVETSVVWARDSATGCLRFEAVIVGPATGPPTSFADLTVLVHDLVEFRLVRHEPWGPSEWVNGGTCEQTGDEVVLKIEMQSGDPIEMRGARYELRWARE